MTTEFLQRQIVRLLEQAAEGLERLDWDLVRARAQAVLALDPENEDARGLLDAAARASRPSPVSPGPQETVPTSFANGRYQVKTFLGEGGKKRVYLAHDTLLDRDVAFALIKTEGLDAEGRERVLREAQAMGKLGTHPHIVSVFDMGQEGESPYLVTELMEGGDVEGLLEKAQDHRLPIEDAVNLAIQVCRGLEFAHDKGLVHRDLKPGNVWLTAPSTSAAAPSASSAVSLGGERVAKIGDFGLAVSLDRSRLTREGMMVGTALYMPPEQATGNEVTARSDLYSLGAMLYQMICGRPPFPGPTPSRSSAST